MGAASNSFEFGSRLPDGAEEVFRGRLDEVSLGIGLEADIYARTASANSVAQVALQGAPTELYEAPADITPADTADPLALARQQVDQSYGA